MEQAEELRSVAMMISEQKTENIYQRYAIVGESDIQNATRRLLGQACYDLVTVPFHPVDTLHVVDIASRLA